MILRVVDSTVCGSYLLDLKFNDGIQRVVDVEPLLNGPVFEALRDPAFFAQATLDPICGTVVWPNGADLAPEALHAAEAATVSTKTTRSVETADP